MIDYEARKFSIDFLDMLFLHIVNLGFFCLAVGRIVRGKPGSFLVSSVGHFSAVRVFYDDVGAGSALCMEPPVVSAGKFKGQLFILKIIFSYIYMIAVAGQEMQGPGGDFYFLSGVFPADITVLGQLFFDLY